MSDSEAAKQLFEETSTDYHFAAAEAKGSERERLLKKAAAGYRKLLRKYPKETSWCAQSLRSLGNVRAEQGRFEEAISTFEDVGKRYRDERWEVIQALKSAGDLCRNKGSSDQAREFYVRIIEEFRDAEAPMMKTIVEAAEKALSVM